MVNPTRKVKVPADIACKIIETHKPSTKIRFQPQIGTTYDMMIIYLSLITYVYTQLFIHILKFTYFSILKLKTISFQSDFPSIYVHEYIPLSVIRTSNSEFVLMKYPQYDFCLTPHSKEHNVAILIVCVSDYII